MVLIGADPECQLIIKCTTSPLYSCTIVAAADFFVVTNWRQLKKKFLLKYNAPLEHRRVGVAW
jgi:hypothetical protein